MRIIKLGLVVLFLFSISGCFILDDTLRKMQADEELNLDEKTEYTNLTEYEQCSLACNSICEKIEKDDCNNLCEKNCSIFTSEPAMEIVCDNESIEKICQFVDEKAYIQAKDEIAKKCDGMPDSDSRNKCFEESIKWLLAQDFAQQKCIEVKAPGKCFAITEQICKEVTKEVMLDEVKCKELKTAYEKNYYICKGLNNEADIIKCIKELDIKSLPDIDKACAMTKITTEECNKEPQPFNKVQLKCAEQISSICNNADQTACDEAYKKLPEVIKANCGLNPGIYDIKYEECYAKTKAALIIPACQQTCQTNTEKKYSIGLEQISANSEEEAITIFLDSLKENPVCTKEEVIIEKPVEEIPPAQEEQIIALSPFIYSGDMFVYVGDTAGCSTAISGLDYNFDWKCSWYMAVAGSDEFKLIPDQNNCSYIVDSVKLELNGSRYFFTVTNAGKTVKSNIVTLFVK